MRRRHFGPILAVFLVACGGSGDGGGRGGSGGSTEECVAPGQGLSQACCLTHGGDACGAELFCAAFDGQEAATCHAEGSRRDRTSCLEDRHCASGSCNVDAGLCRSGRRSLCDPEIGRAPSPTTGGAVVCVAATSTCFPLGDGASGSICAIDSDCQSGGACIDNYCVFAGPRTCGGGEGTGPCAVDPISESCLECRVRSFECTEGCNNILKGLIKCVEREGCVFPDEATGEPGVAVACAASRCESYLCTLEVCSNALCSESNCY